MINNKICQSVNNNNNNTNSTTTDNNNNNPFVDIDQNSCVKKKT